MSVDTGTISVVLVDDHTLFREGLAELLACDPAFRVVAQGSSGTDALALVRTHRPDVALIDVEMPGPGARATVRRLRQEHPDTSVIVLTMHDNVELVRALLAEGAAAYLVKTIERRELIIAVRAVARGRDHILLSVSRDTITWLDKPAPSLLSAREQQVLQLTALAMSNAQIGRELMITEGTVKRHLTNIYAKLGAVSRIDAIRKAIAVQLIPDLEPAPGIRAPSVRPDR